jgi:lysine 2,3-aminomutase
MNEMVKNMLRTRRRSARRIEDLLEQNLVDQQQVPEIEQVLDRFSLAITPAMQDLIARGDAADPIARQFVPDAAELSVLPEERGDPIGDDPHTAIKGIVHRYPDRVLLKPLHVCAVYCRFCFRREKVGPGGEALSPAELEAAIAYIRRHRDIWEVILTGGDPLVMAERRMSEIICALAAIPHVKVIRIHTRVPVVDPARVTSGMVGALKAATPVYVVLHCNHARELTPEARAACARLVDGGIPMLNQSVLLKGVNADPAAMEALLRALVEARVKPYYLHHGDLAEGTSHFRTTIAEGQALMLRLRGRVSGICQPTYVLDIPGGYGKVPIGPSYLHGPHAGDRYSITDYQDRIHAYPPAATVDAAPGAAKRNRPADGADDVELEPISDCRYLASPSASSMKAASTRPDSASPMSSIRCPSTSTLSSRSARSPRL